MTQDESIIGLHQWLATPPGQYLLAWEQDQLDRAVADIFGFHAVQLGLPELEAMRCNRMPHRWLVLEGAEAGVDGQPSPSPAQGIAWTNSPAARSRCAMLANFEALPFQSQSLDLVVLPHTLELARDPHQTLHEVERVLVPEGRVVIAGFNPASLWGVRQRWGRLTTRLGFGKLFLPRAGEFIGYWRVRDWLRLLSFEVESGRFGCYRPALESDQWLQRFRWMEPAGDRWWPVFGAVYFLVAVKRVRGMRLIGPAWKQEKKPRAAPAAVAQKNQESL